MKTLPQQHSEMVAALIKPGAVILETLTAAKCGLLHSVIGLIGEFGELIECLGAEFENRKHLVEEMGDLMFYQRDLRMWLAAHAPANLTYTAKVLKPETPDQMVSVLMITSGKLLDVVKKHVIYNQPLNFELFCCHLEQLQCCLEIIAASCRITEEECLVANIEKLSVRYAAGSYSDAAAQERADKADEAEVQSIMTGVLNDLVPDSAPKPSDN